MSIQDSLSKIKSKLQIDNFTLLYLAVVIGVGISCFGLGRLSVDGGSMEASGVTIIGSGGEVKSSSSISPNRSTISNNKNSSSSPVIDTSGGGNYVASKNGKLYYTTGCKAANRIKPENRVWFDTASDAEKSDLAPSSSCK